MGTHFERQLTPAGRQFIEGVTKTLEKIIGDIIGVFKWFIDHGRDVWWWVKTITEAFLVLKGIEIANSILTLAGALGKLGSVVVSITGAIISWITKARTAAGVEEAVGAGGTAARAGLSPLITSIPAFWLAGSGILATELHRRYGILGKTSAEPRIVAGLPGSGIEGGAARAETNPLFKSSRQIAEEHRKAAEAIRNSTKALEGHSPGFTPAVVEATTQLNTFVPSITAFTPAVVQATTQLNAFVPAVNAAMQTVQGMQFGLGGGGFGLGMGAPGGGGGPPGFTGTSGGILYTEYGPSIDPPGSADYDSNSYNRIGAWPGKTGRLQPGDVALGYGAQAFYHVSPGDTFTDTRGNRVRFADRSGSKNPMNEDVFRLAAGGIVAKPTASVLGERGPEMVLPLTGNLMSRLGHTVNLSFGNISFGAGAEARSGEGFIHEFAETIANEVKRVLEMEHRRSAVV
jgi:hypothetical protein